MSPRRDTDRDREAAQRVVALAAEPAGRLADAVINRVLRDHRINVGTHYRELRERLDGNLSVEDPQGSVLEEVRGLEKVPASMGERERARSPRPSPRQRRRRTQFRTAFDIRWSNHPNLRGPVCEVLSADVDNGFESPDLIVPSAVQAGAMALDSYIVGHRMGVLEARAAITDAWLAGKVECCSDEVTELLFCYSKSGPRLTPQQAEAVWRRTVGFGGSAAVAAGTVNGDFPGLFDKLVQAFRSLLLTDDPDLDFESPVAEAVLRNTLIAVGENLTAHLPDSVRAQVADLWLDVWEAYELLEDVADDIGSGCIGGPWPLVVRYTNRRGLEHLWMVHEAVEEVLGRVLDFDVDDPGSAVELDDDLARAVGCLVAMTSLAAPTESKELPAASASDNGRQALSSGRPAMAAARLR